jgi:PAS domain S-box-containing protein
MAFGNLEPSCMSSDDVAAESLRLELEELRLREARLRAVLDSVPVEISAFDSEQRCVVQNAASKLSHGDRLGLPLESMSDEARSAGIQYGTDGGVVLVNADVPARGEMESLFMETLSSISDAVFVTDDSGALTFICPNVHFIFGWTQDEVERMGNISHLLGDGWLDHDELDRKGELTNLVVIAADKDGDRHNLLVTAKRVSIGNGAILITCRDITELRRHQDDLEALVGERTSELAQANAELAASEEQYRIVSEFFQTVIDALPDALMVINPDHSIALANSAALGSLARGRSLDDLSCHLVSHGSPTPCDEGSEVCPLHEVLTTGEMIRVEHVHNVEDGCEQIVEIIAAPVFDAEGNVVQVIEACRDITERRHAEQALRANEERLRNLIEHSPNGIAIYETLDEGETFIFREFNPSSEQIEGLKRADVLGRRVLDVFPGVEDMGLMDVFRRVWLSGEPESHPVSHYEDGRLEAWRQNSVFRLPSGEVVAVYSDETERMRLRESQRRLEDQLRHSQKMEAVGTLAGGIAHDFNNILAAIMGYTELALGGIQKGTSPEKLVPFIQQVLKASTRAKDLVAQILTFSGRHEVEKRPVSLQPTIKEALKFLRASIPSYIDIDVHVEDEPMTAMANPTQIHQVLVNLCTNAYHAMRDQSGVLRVSVQSVELDREAASRVPNLLAGQYIRMRVSDSGHGIPLDKIERIFEPFYTTKLQGDGTGLGLAVVHGIVVDHGGGIVVQSEVGKGTTFDVFIPKLMVDADERGNDASLGAIPEGSGRILFVDDESDIVNAARMMLEMLGYDVVSFHDPCDALEWFETQSDAIDLVLTDLTMPHMTGLELVQKVREIAPAIPILICSGLGHELSRDTLDTLVIAGVVQKPFSVRELAIAVKDAMPTRA